MPRPPRNPNDPKLLAVLLAEQDAVWAPLRKWTSPLPTNIQAARLRFAVAGVPYFSGGSTDEAGRQSGGRQLAAMQTAGLLELCRPAGRAESVKLTELGERQARGVVRSPQLNESRRVVAQLACLSVPDPKTIDQLWIPETNLAGVQWGGNTKPFVALEELLLPSLARGWCESLADGAGRVYYALTAEGRAEVARPAPEPLAAAPFDDKACKAYFRAFEAARNRMASVVPRGGVRELGYLPLPASHAGCPVGAWALRTRSSWSPDDELDDDTPADPCHSNGTGRGVAVGGPA